MHRLSLQAKADLVAIWDYLFTESGSAAIADSQIHAITERFYLLATHPRLGRVRDNDLGAGRRTYPVNRYIIAYRVMGEDVWILRVIHGSRDLQALMR